MDTSVAVLVIKETLGTLGILRISLRISLRGIPTGSLRRAPTGAPSWRRKCHMVIKGASVVFDERSSVQEARAQA